MDILKSRSLPYGHQKYQRSEKIRFLKTGFLMKQSKYLKFWNKRFIVLTNKNIYSFQGDKNESLCTMNIKLSNCSSVDIVESNNSFVTNIFGKKFTFLIKEKNRNYYFRAASIEERHEWVRVIRLALLNAKILNFGIDEREEFLTDNNADKITNLKFKRFGKSFCKTFDNGFTSSSQYI